MSEETALPTSGDEEASRLRVVEIAKTWLRTPYHSGARIRGAGVDCAMLPAEVYQEAGLLARIEPGHYAPDFHLHKNEERYLELVLSHAKPTKDPKPGDFVLVKVGRVFAHGAIIVDWPLVIEARLGLNVQYCNMHADSFYAGDETTPARERRFFTLWSNDE